MNQMPTIVGRAAEMEAIKPVCDRSRSLPRLTRVNYHADHNGCAEMEFIIKLMMFESKKPTSWKIYAAFISVGGL